MATIPTIAANDPVFVPSVTFLFLRYLRLILIVAWFCWLFLLRALEPQAVVASKIGEDKRDLSSIVLRLETPRYDYRSLVLEIPSRSRNLRDTMTMMPTKSGGMGGTKTASNL